MTDKSQPTCFICKDNTTKFYFSFPKDPVFRDHWMRICDITDVNSTISLKICEDHFDSKWFEIIYSKKRGNLLKLKNEAVPTLIWNPKEKLEEQGKNRSISFLRSRSRDLANKLRQLQGKNAKLQRKYAYLLGLAKQANLNIEELNLK